MRFRLAGVVVAAWLALAALGAQSASAADPGYFSLTGSLSTARAGAAAAPLADGRVLLVSGDDSASAEIFDPATNTFSSAGIGSMSTPRADAVAAPLPDGRVLVAGGVGLQCDPFCPFLSSAEIFDPATNTFSLAGIGSMSVPRYDAVAAPLPDGRVLVAGGCCSSSNPYDYSSAEIFDPATNTFSSAGIGSMSTPREQAVAAPLPDGQVLVVGGEDRWGPGPGPKAELFDPATKTFSSTGIGSMSTSRIQAAAAPLPDGRVLVAGGFIADSLYPCYLSSAEVFDPTSNTFSSEGVGSMSVPRAAAAAAPLSDGVLVAGGYYSADSIGRGCPTAYTCDARTTAEIFRLGPPPTPARPACGDEEQPKPSSATCKGERVTTLGTQGKDVLAGTPGRDVMAGLGGNDRLSGLAGNDLICAGAGNDALKGGKGNDKLYGEAGGDKLKGGPGRDTLKGGAGKDQQIQ